MIRTRRPRSAWLRAVGTGVLALLVLGGEASAQTGGAFRPPSSAVTRLKAAISQLGMRTCAPTLLQAGEFLFDRGDVEFVVQPLGPDSNRWPTVVTAESSHEGGKGTRLSTLIVAPAGSCSGLYQQVIYWPENCEVIKQKVFADFVGEKVSRHGIRVSEMNPGLQLQLMPAGASGCVSIKKELIG